jgi:hypothetical protein
MLGVHGRDLNWAEGDDRRSLTRHEPKIERSQGFSLAWA